MPFLVPWSDAEPEQRARATVQWHWEKRATQARSYAFADNTASLRVSEKIGYRRDGTALRARRGEAAQDVRLLLDHAAFRRPVWTLEVEGVEPCLPLLGVSRG